MAYCGGTEFFAADQVLKYLFGGEHWQRCDHAARDFLQGLLLAADIQMMAGSIKGQDGFEGSSCRVSHLVGLPASGLRCPGSATWASRFRIAAQLSIL